MEVWTRCRVVSTWTRGQAGGVRHTWAAGGGADARLRRVSRGAGGRKWQVWVTPWQGQSSPDRCLRILLVCHSLEVYCSHPTLSHSVAIALARTKGFLVIYTTFLIF